MANNCAACEYKRINNEPELHCYMFKEEFPDCQQFREAGKPQRVVKVNHQRNLLTAAMIGTFLGMTRHK